MTKQLKSYVGGQWVAGNGGWRPLHNPTTGAQIAEASTAGVDMGAAVRQRAKSLGSGGIRDFCPAGNSWHAD